MRIWRAFTFVHKYKQTHQHTVPSYCVTLAMPWFDTTNRTTNKPTAASGPGRRTVGQCGLRRIG